MEWETHFIICAKLKSCGEERSQCTFTWGEVKYPWTIFFFSYQCSSCRRAIRWSSSRFGGWFAGTAPPELGAWVVWPWYGVWWAQGLVISIEEEWETKILSLLHFSKIHFGFVQGETLADGEVWAALQAAPEPGKDLPVKSVRKYDCMVAVPCLWMAAWYLPVHHIQEQLSLCSCWNDWVLPHLGCYELPAASINYQWCCTWPQEVKLRKWKMLACKNEMDPAVWILNYGGGCSLLPKPKGLSWALSLGYQVELCQPAHLGAAICLPIPPALSVGKN